MDAIGYSRARVREELIDIYFGGVAATRGGLATPTPLEELRKVVENPAFTIRIDLHLGDAEYTVYTSDLSPEYVDFNRSEYSMLKRATLV
jgi:glutamate N-acetyltransferase/amino-acid N-acetyltransferase